MTCEVPGCHRRARYSSPGNWCGTHWQAWWNFGLKRSMKTLAPKWLRAPTSRKRTNTEARP